MITVQELRNELERKKGQRFQTEKTLSRTKREIKENNKSLVLHEKAREIIRMVGLKTQEQLQFHISDVVSLALESVFANPYKLELDFVKRRDKTECDIWFVRNDERVKPINASGGGAVDIASLALRVASWSMKTPRTRPVLILDEPTKMLSKDLSDKASFMLKEISNKLGIQMIIITHDSALSMWADKGFTATIKNGITKIK